MTEKPDPRLSFDSVPELYDKVRPSYPGEVFDRLFASVPTAPQIVEVGPGTGQATGSLLDRGATVTAVELGGKLASALTEKFAQDALLTVVHADFEHEYLPAAEPGSFEGLVSATAYHWIGTQAQLEASRLVRPGGVLAIIDLIQVGSTSDQGYFDRVQPIYAAFGQDRHNWTPPTHANAEPLIFERLKASGQFRRVSLLRVPWDQTYASEAYRDLLLTYSGTQMMSEPARQDMVDQLVGVIDNEFDSTITRPLVATLTLATV